MKNRSERRKTAGAGYSEVWTPPAHPLQTRKHTDGTDYNTLCHS